ncbi:MAG: multicopper oxidase family protein [Burkholderiaceae bacterium]
MAKNVRDTQLPRPSRRALLRALAGAAALGAAPNLRVSANAPPDGALAEICRTRRFESALPTGLQGDFMRITPLARVRELRASPLPAITAPDAPRLTAGYVITGAQQRVVNPVLLADAGRRIAFTQSNALSQRTSWHWHGIALPEKLDGVHTLTDPAQSLPLEFTTPTRGGTFWLHPHPHGETARQTFLGLACPLIVRDEIERALAKQLELALGEGDVVLQLQDARYGADGRVVYALREGEAYEGVFGACITVNGVDAPVWDAPSGWLRLRSINAANARMFKLGVRQGGAWQPMLLIGVDQGLLPAPIETQHVFLAPGQRVDVLLDTRVWSTAVPAFLASDTFDPMHGKAQAHEKSGLPHGSGIALMQIKPGKPMLRLPPLPKVLDDTARWQGAAPAADRDFTLTTTGTLWRMNGKTFKLDEVPIELARGAREVWSFNNSQRAMPHPMHLHGFSFSVLARKDSPEQVRALAIDAQGRLANDLGINDTVQVWPGETVRIAVDFAHRFTTAQRYVVHCHNLEHEDGGLMLNFSVAA